MKKMATLLLLLTFTLASFGLHAEEERFVDKAGRTVKKGAEVAGKGVEKGVDAAGRGVKKGAEATGGFLKRTGDWIGRKLGGTSESDKNKDR